MQLAFKIVQTTYITLHHLLHFVFCFAWLLCWFGVQVSFSGGLLYATTTYSGQDSGQADVSSPVKSDGMQVMVMRPTLFFLWCFES